MASRWILHVKEYCKQHSCSYKDGLSRARASYKPMKGGAMSGQCCHGINPIGLERTVGGKFSLKQLANDAGKISKKILKIGVPAMAGIGTTIETGNPMAGMAAAKGATKLTNYVLGGRRARMFRRL